jgi:hypothetical protein
MAAQSQEIHHLKELLAEKEEELRALFAEGIAGNEECYRSKYIGS